MKPTVYDWVISLILHIGLIGSLVLPQLTQPPKLSKPIIDAPVYWVSIENVVGTPNSVSSNNAKNVIAKKANTSVSNEIPTSIKAPTDTQQVTSKVTAKKSVVAEQTVKKNSQPTLNVTKAKTPAEIKAQATVTKKTSVDANQAVTKTKKITETNTTKKTTAKVVTEESKNDVKVAGENLDQPQAQPKNEQKTQNVLANSQSVTKPIAKIEPTPQVKTETKSETKPKIETRPVPKVETKPDNVAQWKSQFVATVKRYKSYPSTAKRAGIEGTVLMGVHVTASGQIHCYVKQGSGNVQLDNAATQAANRAASSLADRLSTNQDLSFDFPVYFTIDE